MLNKTIFFCIAFQLAFLGPSLSTKQVHPKLVSDSPQTESSPELDLTQQELDFLDRHPVIKVGNEEAWAPFDYNQQGKPMGYAIDHLRLLGQKLGVSFEFVNGYTWAELLGLFRQEEIDLLPSLWISESRKRYMSFTQPFIKLPYVLITKKGNAAIEDFQDLKGRTVAVPKSYKQEEVLKTDYPEIGIYTVKDTLEGLKAVNYGQADAYIGYRGTVDHLLATRFLSDLTIKSELDVPGLGPQGLYIAVQKDMAPLRSALQKAMDALTPRKEIELARKWISINQLPSFFLSPRERLFLEENPVLYVDSLEGWPPFNFRENGKPQGFCVDYVRLLADKLGVRFEFVSGPSWQDFLGLLRQGEIDLLCDVVETKRRQGYIRFTRPYFTIFPGIVTKKGSDYLTDLEALAGRRVAVPKGFYCQEILGEHYPEIQVVPKKDTLACMKSVSSSETAAALAEKPVFDYLINKYFFLDLKSSPVTDNFHLKNIPVSLGVSRDRPVLAGILDKAIEVITPQELNRIKGKWLDYKTEEHKDNKFPLSAKERQYLGQRDSVTVCVQASRLPHEGIDEQGDYVGMLPDVLDILSQRIGIEFEHLVASNRKDALGLAQDQRCELVSSLDKDQETAEHFLFTRPVLKSPRVIVARDDQPYIPGLEAVHEKELGIVAKDPVQSHIQEQHPEIEVAIFSGVDQALRAVSKGTVDFVVTGAQTANYKARELGLLNLKIAGETPFKEFVRLGVHKDDAPLRSVLNKAIATLSEEEINEINKKWMTMRFEHGFDYRLLWQILSVFILVFALILYWNRKLSRLNREIAKAHTELAEKNEELEKLAATDKLTGIFNRLHLEEVLEQEFARCRRYNRPLSIIMMDIDDFKAVNDAYGHLKGDEILRTTARELQKNIREPDTVGRWGGEEFLIICPETCKDEAYPLADKLQKKVAGLRFQDAEAITGSFGLAQLGAKEGIEDLIRRVDQALYQAKDAGKNQVICLL